MRKLTDEEINQAPEWVTHYLVDEDNDILFESETGFCWLINGEIAHYGSGYGSIDKNSVEAYWIEKSFDIAEHPWCDERLAFDGNLKIRIDRCHNCSDQVFHYEDIALSKADGIAIAKALGVTAEDLK